MIGGYVDDSCRRYVWPLSEKMFVFIDGCKASIYFLSDYLRIQIKPF